MGTEVKKINSFSKVEDSNDREEVKKLKDKNKELRKIAKEAAEYAKQLEIKIESTNELLEILKKSNNSETISTKIESLESDVSLLKRAVSLLLKQNSEIKHSVVEKKNLDLDKDYDLYYNLSSNKFKELLKFVCYVFDIEKSYDSIYESLRFGENKIKRCKTMYEFISEVSLDDSNTRGSYYPDFRRDIVQRNICLYNNSKTEIYRDIESQYLMKNNVDAKIYKKLIDRGLCFRGYCDNSGWYKEIHLLTEHLEGKWDKLYDMIPDFDVDTWNTSSICDDEVDNLISELEGETNDNLGVSEDNVVQKEPLEEIEYFDHLINPDREPIWSKCYLDKGYEKIIAKDYCKEEYGDDSELSCSNTVDAEWIDEVADNPEYKIYYAYKKEE